MLRILAFLACLAAVAPAAATEFCGLRPTSDGFVALRAGPSAQARLIARMRVGDEVMLGLDRVGPWIAVRWWRGDTRLTRGFATGRRGWVHGALLDEICG
ncbi:MAG: SH3 domain-containing protein [Methylobacteriaceae bacterium]|nr:SH3 domain-containing protein [Methylobacteriaceae bacterium]